MAKGVRLIGMVPVMELRRGEHPLQWPEGQPDIGMNEVRLDEIDGAIGSDCLGGKAEQRQRQGRAERREDLIDRMDPVRGQPVQLLDAVVHGVEAPQERHGMDKPVGGIKADIRHDDGQRRSGPERQRGDAAGEPGGHQGARVGQRKAQDEHGTDADDDGIEQQIDGVVEPAAAQDALFAPIGDKPFERHENQQQDQNFAKIYQARPLSSACCLPSRTNNDL